MAPEIYAERDMLSSQYSAPYWGYKNQRLVLTQINSISSQLVSSVFITVLFGCYWSTQVVPYILRRAIKRL